MAVVILMIGMIIMVIMMTILVITFLIIDMALVTSKDIMVEGILEGITMVAITLVDTMAAIMALA